MRTVRANGGTPRRKRGRGDSGAALVEMAIVSLFLFAIVFGIIDFGWAFMKNIDVRHGAREVGRLAAVNFDDGTVPGTTQGQRIVNAACDRMDGDSSTTVVLDVSDATKVEVTVTQTFDTLTGFYDPFLPNTLTSNVSMRMEQTQGWDTTPVTPNSYVCGVAT